MRNFGARLFYQYDISQINKAMSSVVNLLGFKPQFMSIYCENKFDRRDIEYNTVEMFNYLKMPLTSILIKNELDNSQNNLAWFRLTIDNVYHNNFKLEWSNKELSFLVNNEEFVKLKEFNEFICGYCYDSDDTLSQTNKSIAFRNSNLGNREFKITKDQFNDIAIDTSDNWGRIERAAGLDFMAAPLMWFGNNFFRIIPKEKLLQFAKSKLLEKKDSEIVYIELFYLSELPSKNENRKQQEAFWAFFDFKNTIEQYSKDNAVDEEVWLKMKLDSKNNRNKKR